MTCSKKRYIELIEELDENIHGYSFFKWYLLHCKPDPRILIQFKCFELFKWELNEDTEDEIAIEDVIIKWSEDGYAKAFEKAYKQFESNENICICQLYSETIRIKEEIVKNTI